MCIEIEAKLKIDLPEAVERKLYGLGAQFVAEQQQKDYHFDDAAGSLARGDKCLRLRRQREEKGERFFLTFKGAKEKSSFKKRQEIEIEIKDADSTEKLLAALGYEKALAVEKRRRLWRLGECEIALDHLPLLGDFVEIEGPDEGKIADVQKQIGLSGLPHIPKSYAALVKAKLRELGKKQDVNGLQR
jgi:adenylate cyclase class 2